MRVTIRYFCHPFFGHEVEVALRLVQGGIVYYQILLPDGSHSNVPAWMTDAIICRQFVFQDRPACSLEALQNLAEFLDHLE